MDEIESVASEETSDIVNDKYNTFYPSWITESTQ